MPIAYSSIEDVGIVPILQGHEIKRVIATFANGDTTGTITLPKAYRVAPKILNIIAIQSDGISSVAINAITAEDIDVTLTEAGAAAGTIEVTLIGDINA